MSEGDKLWRVYELTIIAPNGDSGCYAGMTGDTLARRKAGHKSDAKRHRMRRIVARWVADRGLDADNCEWHIEQISTHDTEHECRIAEAQHILTNRHRLMNDRIEVRLR